MLPRLLIPSSPACVPLLATAKRNWTARASLLQKHQLPQGKMERGFGRLATVSCSYKKREEELRLLKNLSSRGHQTEVGATHQSRASPGAPTGRYIQHPHAGQEERTLPGSSRSSPGCAHSSSASAMHAASHGAGPCGLDIWEPKEAGERCPLLKAGV